jgi:hypothetical protein
MDQRLLPVGNGFLNLVGYGAEGFEDTHGLERREKFSFFFDEI